jgi:cyclase
MLKKRLIPCIIIKGDLVVQSFFFKRYLPIGDAKTAIEFFVDWDVDEIVLLDINATKENRGPNLEIIRWASKECFVPLTIGGGIKSIIDIQSVLKAGADKICINSYAIDNPFFISESSKKFGSQCITVSIDVRIHESGEYEVFSRNGKKATGRKPNNWAKEVESLGAGEILLNSIDRDGSRKGFDIKLLNLVSGAVGIPVIACGGVGKIEHLSEGIIDGNCHAVAAANIFQHTEHSTVLAKAHLKKMSIPIRVSSNVNYDGQDFDHLGRPL